MVYFIGGINSSAISKGKTQNMKDDLLMLIDITTFELTVNNKKELKIKLFEVLDRLVSSDNHVVEVLSHSNVRTFVENADRVAEKYGFSFSSSYRKNGLSEII